jgi:hypothetical protein
MLAAPRLTRGDAFALAASPVRTSPDIGVDMPVGTSDTVPEDARGDAHGPPALLGEFAVPGPDLVDARRPAPGLGPPGADGTTSGPHAGRIDVAVAAHGDENDPGAVCADPRAEEEKERVHGVGSPRIYPVGSGRSGRPRAYPCSSGLRPSIRPRRRSPNRSATARAGPRTHRDASSRCRSTPTPWPPGLRGREGRGPRAW